MSLGPLRTAKLALWTVAGVTWSWAAIASAAGTPATEATSAPPPSDPTTAPAADGGAAALPEGEPGRVLVLRLSRPETPEVVVRRVYVDAATGETVSRSTRMASDRTSPSGSSPVPAEVAPRPVPEAPAPVAPPPPQRSSGS